MKKQWKNEFEKPVVMVCAGGMVQLVGIKEEEQMFQIAIYEGQKAHTKRHRSERTGSVS